MVITATCPRCARDIRVNGDGSLRRHEADGKPCPGTDAVMLTIGLPLDGLVITQNQLRRMHHHAEAKAKAELITAARWAIRATQPKPIFERVVVRLHYRPGTRRIIDPDSLAPTLKCCIDALVKESVLPHGDDWRYVAEAACRIHPPLLGLDSAYWLEVAIDRVLGPLGEDAS